MKQSLVLAVSLVINVGLLILLVPHLGARGASAATLGSSGVGAVLALMVFARRADLPLRDCIVPHREDLRRLWGLRPMSPRSKARGPARRRRD